MRRDILTVPNIICIFRLAGSPVLIVLAFMDRSEAFLWLYLFLAMTDWIDGKLAILLNQRTVIGARLDSWADTALYAALGFGAVKMHGAVLRPETAYIGAALGTILVSIATALWKFRRWPSYHTRAAKITWFFIMVGTVSLFLEWHLWPLRLALLAITVTHAEILLITIVSPTLRVDVPSLYHAWRDRGGIPTPSPADGQSQRGGK